MYTTYLVHGTTSSSHNDNNFLLEKSGMLPLPLLPALEFKEVDFKVGSNLWAATVAAEVSSMGQQTWVSMTAMLLIFCYFLS